MSRLLESADHRVGDIVVRVGPGIDHLVVPFPEGDYAAVVRLREPVHVLLGLAEDLLLLDRDFHVIESDGNAGLRRVAEPEVLELVEERRGVLESREPERPEDEVPQGTLAQRLVHVRHPGGQDRVEEGASDAGHDPLPLDLAVVGLLVDEQPNRQVVVRRPRLRAQISRFQRHFNLVRAREVREVRSRRVFVEVRPNLRHVVASEDHVLGRRRDRPAVRGFQDVVARQHEDPRLELRLERQRNVHRHLVAVEVRVERRAHERVNADGLPLHEHRLEGLDPQPVKRRGPVQEHRVVLDDVLEDLVDRRVFEFDELLGALHGLRVQPPLEFVDDERLEQLDRHLLGQPALVQPEFRTHDDDRPAGVVDALSEQILPEPALLALEHVRQRLERPLAPSANRLAAPPVVEQRVHRLLEHALLVAEDHLRRAHFQQLLEPVVPIDHAAVEVVEVRCREPSTVQRDEGTQIRRNHRDHIHDHVLGAVTLRDFVVAVADRVDYLEPLELLLLPVLRGLVNDLVAQLLGEFVNVQLSK